MPNKLHRISAFSCLSPRLHPLTESMQEVDVAVIIVTYKCAALTIDCLRSVALERSDPSIRIRAIIIDNASGDSASIAQAIESNHWSSWVTLITAPINGGFAYGNNLGIEAAYADGTPSYLYLLNPDAQVRSSAIGSLVRFLDAHPKVGIAGSSFENLDGSDWPLAFRFPSLMSEVLQGIDLGFLSRLFQRWVVAQTMPKTASTYRLDLRGVDDDSTGRRRVYRRNGRELFPIFRRNRFLSSRQARRIFDVVRSRKPGDAYLGTKHDCDGHENRAQATTCLLVRIPKTLFRHDLRRR